MSEAGLDSLGPQPAVALRLAQRLADLAGWRRLAVAFGLGILAAAALPPIYGLPLLWIAFPGMLWLLDGVKSWPRALLLGWVFGLGFFIAGLYWIGHAFLIEAERFAVIMPFAVGGLSAYMALFVALAFLVVWLSGSRGLPRVLLLGAAWITAEWLRSWMLTGFAWNLMGTVWAFSSVPLQLSSVTGVWGLSLLTVIAAAAPACLSRQTPREHPHWVVVALALGLPAMLWSFGAVRLAMAPPVGAESVPGVELRIVQPSIDQKQKWAADLRASHVAGQMALSSGPAARRPSHVIWAETAVPFLLADIPELRSSLAKIIPPEGLLITGAPRRAVEAGEVRVWNSLFALDAAGEVAAVYDKQHLVPLGEYVPLRSLLPIEKLSSGGADFTSGVGPRLLTLPGLPPAVPLICYEIIFPGRVVSAGTEPAWILNITNDAWFGTSPGPYQHFASARLRAVEEGLPLVRAANSGISAVVDPYGRVIARLGLDRIGTIDAPLPQALQKRTIFARLGNWSLLILLIVTISLRRIVRGSVM